MRLSAPSTLSVPPSVPASRNLNAFPAQPDARAATCKQAEIGLSAWVAGASSSEDMALRIRFRNLISNAMIAGEPTIRIDYPGPRPELQGVQVLACEQGHPDAAVIVATPPPGAAPEENAAGFQGRAGIAIDLVSIEFYLGTWIADASGDADGITRMRLRNQLSEAILNGQPQITLNYNGPHPHLNLDGILVRAHDVPLAPDISRRIWRICRLENESDEAFSGRLATECRALIAQMREVGEVNIAMQLMLASDLFNQVKAITPLHDRNARMVQGDCALELHAFVKDLRPCGQATARHQQQLLDALWESGRVGKFTAWSLM